MRNSLSTVDLTVSNISKNEKLAFYTLWEVANDWTEFYILCIFDKKVYVR